LTLSSHRLKSNRIYLLAACLLEGYSSNGVRRGLRLEITSKELEALEHEWAEHLHSKISDVESMIRIAFLALTSGRGEVPASFLDRLPIA
jgi:hypothetical protein